LKNETDESYTYNKRNDTFSTTETSTSLQANLERPENQHEPRYRISPGDSDGNNNDEFIVKDLNQTYSTRSQELPNRNDSHKNDSKFQNTVYNETLSANSLVSKFRSDQNVSDTVSHDYRFFDLVTSQRSVANSSLNADEFNSSHTRSLQNSTTDNINEGSFNSNPQKDSFNLTIIHDLIDTVSSLMSTLQNSQKSMLRENQLHDTNPARNASNASKNSHININRYIQWQENAQESSDIVDNVSRISEKNILNSRVIDKMFIANQILLNARNIVNLMTKPLPESLKSAIGMLDQIVRIFQHFIALSVNALFEIVKDKRYFDLDNFFKGLSGTEVTGESSAQRNQSVLGMYSNQNVETIGNAVSLANQQSWDSGYVSRQIENMIPAGNKSGDPAIDRPSLASNSEHDRAINAFERKDNLTANNSTMQNDEQFTSLINKENYSVPIFRSLSDFGEHKSIDGEDKNNLSSLQISKDVNNAIDEKQSVKDLAMSQRFNQTEMKNKELEKANENETRYKDEYPSPVLTDLSEKSERDESNDTVAETMSSFQFGMSTIPTNMEQQERDTGATQVLSANVTNDASYLKRPIGIFRRNLSSIINESIEDENVRINNNFLELDNYSPVIGNSGQKENVNKQLAAAKLQDVGNRLINALRPIMKKKMIKSDDRTISFQDKNLQLSNTNSANMIYKRNLNHEVSMCMFM